LTASKTGNETENFVFLCNPTLKNKKFIPMNDTVWNNYWEKVIALVTLFGKFVSLSKNYTKK
jgi:hypothetical protein